jgi:hypothetical protein
MIGGSWCSSRATSKRQSSRSLSSHAMLAIQPSWPSIPVTNCPILAAAASAWPCWIRMLIAV